MRNLLFLVCLGLGLLSAAGCAVTASSAMPISPQAPTYSGMGVHPSFYNNDPALEYWYTPPYFNPYIGSR